MLPENIVLNLYKRIIPGPVPQEGERDAAEGAGERDAAEGAGGGASGREIWGMPQEKV